MELSVTAIYRLIALAMLTLWSAVGLVLWSLCD